MGNLVTGVRFLDKLVRRKTAFRSWTELLTKVRDGFVPTLDSRDADQMLLCRMIYRAGGSVYLLGRAKRGDSHAFYQRQLREQLGID